MDKTLSLSWSDCVIGIVVIILFCVTLLLNILALHYTYIKIRKPSNKKIPHLLVGALSLSGLGIAIFEYPPFIASRFKGEWLYNSGVCNFVAFVVVLFGNLTICMVVLMSLERLGAIVFPFFYKEYVNFRKAVLILLFLVGYSVFLATIPLFLDRIRLNVSTGVCTYSVDSHNTNTKVVVAIIVTHYIASILIMFISNMIVVRTVSMLDRNTMSGEYENRCRERKQHNNHACLNFAKMVGVLAFCYTICWTVILLRILLLYVYGWRNYYYDQVVIVLITFDPLINHCVCLWIMRKYRDGYASSMGSLISCFKISDDGIWATTLTRLSTISRRSTYSRASTRSSSRQSSKPYFYKQVPQNAENPPQDYSPEGEEIPDQTFKHKQDTDNICDKKIISDDKRDWSDIIRELKAEKENQEDDGSSPEKIHVIEKGALHDDGTTRNRPALERWRAAFKKLKSMKAKGEAGNKETNLASESSAVQRHDVLATLHERREDLPSEKQSTASGGNLELQRDVSRDSPEKASSDDVEAIEQSGAIVQTLSEQEQSGKSPSSEEKSATHSSADDVEAKEQPGAILQTLNKQGKNTKSPSSEEKGATYCTADDVEAKEQPGAIVQALSDDVEAKEQWEKILKKLNEQEKSEEITSRPSNQKERPSSTTDVSQAGEKSNLPELLQELSRARSEEQPELLRHRTTANPEEEQRQVDLPEIVQDTTAKKDGTPSRASTEDDGKTPSAEDHGTQSRNSRDPGSRDLQRDEYGSEDESSPKESKPDQKD